MAKEESIPKLVIDAGKTLDRRTGAVRFYPVIIVMFLWWQISNLPLYRKSTSETSPSHQAVVMPSCASTLQPLGLPSFLARQKTLARTLLDLNASAYVSEPGPNSLYYFNISRSAWKLSERPFLFVVVPAVDKTGVVYAQTSILVPSFEESRAKSQLFLAAERPTYLPWQESESPYAALPKIAGDKVFIDEELRVGIMGDLGESFRSKSGGQSISVLPSPPQIRAIRERKTPEELDRLRCANEITLQVIRATRDEVRLGMTETEINDLLSRQFERAGMGKIGGLVLIGENAALPHGSPSERKLEKKDFLLIDAGGYFQGYTADITRTFAFSFSEISRKQLKIWHLVRDAQAAAYAAVKPGINASEVDFAARNVIGAAGLDHFFTHRLGHGIGIEGHEAPYLHAGNSAVTLAPGNSFSNEPGVYLEGVVGVRLEDCWFVDEHGTAVSFTRAAVSPWEI